MNHKIILMSNSIQLENLGMLRIHFKKSVREMSK